MGLSIEGESMQEEVEEDDEMATCKVSRVLIWRNWEERDWKKKSFSSMQMKEVEDRLKWVGVGLNRNGKFLRKSSLSSIIPF